MALAATLLALALPAPAHPVCATHVCEARVAHRRTRRRWRQATAPYRAWLARTRACESGGRYSTNTANGFYGAYQFTLNSWRSVGGTGMPNLAEPLEQDYRAVRLLWSQGRGAWPVCG